MSEPLAVEYWSSMTPIRLLFLFPLTAYTYIFKADGTGFAKGKFYKAGPGDHLKNGMIFTWAFLELVLWFWVCHPLKADSKKTRANVLQVYVGLRDQRRQAAMKVLERRKAEEGML
jgi:hypothetical protein